MTAAAKGVLRKCCRTVEAGKSKPVAGTEPLWHWLAGQAAINDALRACRK